MFQLKISTDNAAFCAADGREDPIARALEVARILRDIAGQLDALTTDDEDGVCIDFNGNKVGTWGLT